MIALKALFTGMALLANLLSIVSLTSIYKNRDRDHKGSYLTLWVNKWGVIFFSSIAIISWGCLNLTNVLLVVFIIPLIFIIIAYKEVG